MSVRALALLLATLALPVHAAVIEGRVTHPSRAGATAGVQVQAIGIDASEQTIVRETVADDDGSFRFDDLPAPAAYLVRALFEGFMYPGGAVVFRPGEPEASDPVVFRVYDRTDDASALHLRVVQWVVEHDAGAYQVRQSATVSNAGSRVAVAAPDAPPLLRLGLAPGHGELRTGLGRLPPGAELGDGALEIRGPVFPGEQGYQIELAYDLESPDGALELSVPVPDPIEELQVYVKDWGIDITSDGLHPARVARQSDVFYQSFVGFDVPAGATRRLSVSPLPPASSASRWGSTIAAALLAGALVLFVGRPVTSGARARTPEPVALDDARARLTMAIADLDHDYETGKLSDADRDRLREELRRTEVERLARERGLLGAASTPGEVARSCCGRSYGSEDRFCSSCGKPL